MPPCVTSIVVPLQAPLAIVPTLVRDEVTTFEASVVPVSVPAGAALNVAKLPNALPPVFVQVMTPVFAIVQSPERATAVAVAPALPTQIFVFAKDGSDAAGVAQLLSPRRKAVALGVPVTAVILLVPMPVRLAPEPLNVVPVTVPVMLAPPAETVSPPAVMESPPLLTVGETRLGEVASTTLPVPVGEVVHWIAVPLVAVQKSLVVRVPVVRVDGDPTAIQPVPLQYTKVWMLAL